MVWSIGQAPLPVRMAAAPSGEFNVKEILTRSYGTGKYSDLIVRAAGQDFKVHRMVVCEQCHFFDAALKHDWEEAQTGIIEVKETAAVMDIIFRYMYGQPLPFLPMKKDSDEVLREKATPDNFYLALDVLKAADKYLLDGLSRAADLALLNCIHLGGVENVVFYAAALQDLGQGQVGNLFLFAVFKLSETFEELLSHEEAWYTPHARADLQKLVIDLKHDDCPLGDLPEFFASKTGRPQSDFQVPSTRHGWYAKRANSAIHAERGSTDTPQA